MSQENKIDNLKREIERLSAENQALLKLASHDLRSPLNKIFALVNLIKMSDGPLDEDQQGYLQNIELILSDTLHRLRNLTELQAIEANQVKVTWELVDLQTLLGRLTREYEVQAARKNLKLSLVTEPVETMSDRLIITRILDQLLSNAFKFSPKESEVKLSLQSGGNGYWLIVEDGGVGISEAEQAELFKKFKVLSTPTTGGESKTGLGLYIAQDNAIRLGGKITYNNAEGSRFIVEIPYTALA